MRWIVRRLPNLGMLRISSTEIGPLQGGSSKRLPGKCVFPDLCALTDQCWYALTTCRTHVSLYVCYAVLFVDVDVLRYGSRLMRLNPFPSRHPFLRRYPFLR